MNAGGARLNHMLPPHLLKPQTKQHVVIDKS